MSPPAFEQCQSAEPGMAAVSGARRFAAAFAAIAGALPLVLGAWVYEFTVTAFSQIGAWRTWGLLGVLAIGLALIALAGAALVALLRLDHASAGFRRATGAAFCLAVGLNAAAVGTAVFPPADEAWALLSLVPLSAMGLAYWRHSEADRALLAATLYRAGLVLLALPALAAPGVAWAYADYRPRLAASPPRPEGMPALPDAPARIVVITFDALRYRSTSFAAPARDLTPALRAIAREGTWYANCRSASDRTLVSMPTVLSGVRPSDFYQAVDNRGGYLRAGLLTGLGGLLAPAGYRAHYASMLIAPTHMGLGAEFLTGAVINPLYQPLRFNQGAFLPMGEAAGWLADSLVSPREAAAAPTHPIRATRETFEYARKLLGAASGRTLLWVHVGVPHDPFFEVPEADLGGQLHPERYAKADEAEVSAAVGPALARYERMYESYVRFADAELARFVRDLKRDGLWEESLVVVTADHGEAFSAEVQLHGREVLSEDITRVPLVVRMPGRAGGGRDDRLAGHEDIVPTILSRVYGRAPAALHGRDLFAPAAPERTIYTWADYSHRVATGNRPLGAFAAYRGPLKYAFSRADGKEALYDLAADPAERHDLRHVRPQAFAELRAQAHRELNW